MPQYSAGQVYIESGLLGSSTMAAVQLITSAKADFSPPRTNVMTWGRGKPLEQRPVVNYTPANGSFDFLKRDNMIEQCLGIINPTGIAALITDTRAATATYGIRSMQVYFAPTSSTNYNGLLDLRSGVLTSYTLQGGVSDGVRGSFGMQFLNMSGSVNTTARATTNYAVGLVKPEGQFLTGLGSATNLQLTGFGITGVTIQSFSFNVGFQHASIQQLGQQYPIERPLTDVQASLQINGFFEGINNSLTGLNIFACGYPAYGTVALTMTPSCVPVSPSTVTIINPYLDSWSVDGQAGGFSTFSMSFSMPLGPNPNENTDGSVVFLT